MLFNYQLSFSNILYKLNSDISNKIIFLGSLLRICLTISEPMDPPAPDTKKIFYPHHGSLLFDISSRNQVINRKVLNV